MNDNQDHLKAKADELLQEIRIVLPGTQALLGFQFVVFFNPVFQGLSAGLQFFHYATLTLTMLSTIALIAPVAYQQIREGGQTTKRFINFSSNMLTGSMALLLLALSGDAYIAARLIRTNTNLFAILMAAAIFAVGAGTWFVYTLLKRNSK